MRADYILLQKLIKINEDKDDQKKPDPESDEDESGEKDQSVVDKVKEKQQKKGDDKETPLQKELKNTCKCPNCGYIGSSKEFKVELVNSDDE